MEDYTKAWLPPPMCLVHAVLLEIALGALMIVFRLKHALIIALLPGFLITFPLAKNVHDDQYFWTGVVVSCLTWTYVLGKLIAVIDGVRRSSYQRDKDR